MLTVSKKDADYLRPMLKDYRRIVNKAYKDRNKITRPLLKSKVSRLRKFISDHGSLLKSNNLDMWSKYWYLQLIKILPLTLFDLRYLSKHSEDQDYLDQVCCPICGKLKAVDHGKYILTCSYKCGTKLKNLKAEETFNRRIKEIGKFDLLTPFKGYRKKVKVKCHKCGHTHLAFPQNLLRQKYCCVKCWSQTLKNPIYWDWDAFIKESNRLFKGRYTYKKCKLEGMYTRLSIKCGKCGNSYSQLLIHHLYENGCPYCFVPKYSNMCNDLVQRVSKATRLKFESKGTTGTEHCITWKDTVYRIDGYNKRYKICLEFNGDVFHGNPKLYKPDQKVHPYRDITSGELYKQTCLKQRRLKSLDYNVISVWENDWLKDPEKCVQRVCRQISHILLRIHHQ